MKIAVWRSISGLALAGSLVVTPPAVGYAVEALGAEPGVRLTDTVAELRLDDNDNAWESNDDNDNADEAAAPPAPVAPEGVDPNPSNNDPNNNGDQSGGGGDTSGSQP